MHSSSTTNSKHHSSRLSKVSTRPDVQGVELTIFLENNGAWFGKVGGETPGDDALPLLCTTNKPYRALILSNSISTFDFRIYLFARQAALLSELGRISDVAKRGEYFISTFARTLRENEATLGRNFVESWTYSACLNVVDECQKWVDQTRIDTRVVAGFVAVKAELLELARKQVSPVFLLPTLRLTPFTARQDRNRGRPSSLRASILYVTQRVPPPSCCRPLDSLL
jgi:hypothetical protein